MSTNLSRSYAAELNAFASKNVILTTTTGKVVNGVLIGLNPDDMNVILADAVVDGKSHKRIFLAGSTISEITLGEAPFDMNKLRMELERVFKKTGVRYFDDTRTILVMDRYKVTEDDVEGEGPVADRIRRIWQALRDEYLGQKETSEEE